MSFLFNDDTLSEIVIKSGLFAQINKYGQQVNDEAKFVAVKLTNNLLNQAIDKGNASETEIYVKDLVDLDAYLNFLLKNEQRYDGKLIVYHDAQGSSPPPDADKYSKYKDFYVIKDALLSKLHDLDMAANQTNNEVMKPLVKNLISQVNSALHTSYEAMKAKNPNGSINPSGDGSHQSSDDDLPNERGSLSGHPRARGRNSNPYKNINYQSDEGDENNGSGDNSANTNNSLQSIMNNLPLSSDDALSPYAMQSFIGSVDQFIGQSPKLNDGRLNVEFNQYHNSMTQNIAAWSSFINRVASENKGAANVQSYQTEVPYNRNNRPNTTLETIFGNNFNAKEAAQRLLQMVLLVQQACASLLRSPQLTSIMGKDILNGQINKAKAFAETLTPYARS